MKRVLAVLLIGAFTTLALGVEDTSWAVQSAPVNSAGTRRDPLAQSLSTLRRGATVEIELSNGSTFYAVIEEIAVDTVTVLREQDGKTVTQTIGIADMKSIKAVTAREIAHSHKTLIISAIVAGLLVVGFVGACRSASSSDRKPIAIGT